MMKSQYCPNSNRRRHLTRWRASSAERGFSLIEMAIVMVIIGALLGGLLMPLSTQRDVNNRKAAEQQLEEISSALLGFAQLRSRLPCPANLDGLEVRNGANNCSFVNGFVPYATLGLQGSIKNRRLIDPWLNPIRYRITDVGTWEYTKQITLTNADPNFRICSDASCAPANIIAQGVTVAVILSTGKDGTAQPISTSPDQVLNRSGGNDFVMRSATEDHATGIEFDDILVSISRPILIYELGKVGRL